MGRARNHHRPAVTDSRFALLGAGRGARGADRLDAAVPGPGARAEADRLSAQLAAGELTDTVRTLRGLPEGAPMAVRLLRELADAAAGQATGRLLGDAELAARADLAGLAPRTCRSVIISYGVLHLTDRPLSTDVLDGDVCVTRCAKTLDAHQFQRATRGLWHSGRQAVCRDCEPHEHDLWECQEPPAGDPARPAPRFLPPDLDAQARRQAAVKLRARGFAALRDDTLHADAAGAARDALCGALADLALRDETSALLDTLDSAGVSMLTDGGHVGELVGKAGRDAWAAYAHDALFDARDPEPDGRVWLGIAREHLRRALRAS